VLSSLGHYAHAMVWPFSPTVLRGKTEVAANGTLLVETQSVLFGVAVLLGLVVLGARAIKRDRVRPWLADLAWVLLPLLPVLNLVPLKLPALVADRFLYLPALGLAALVSRAIWQEGPRLGRAALMVSSTVGLVWLIASASVVARHAEALGSDETLWQYELERDRSRPYVLERAIAMAQRRGDQATAFELSLEGMALVSGRRLAGSEASFLMSTLGSIARATPDLDQERLRALLAFYDGLRAGQKAVLELPALELPGRDPISPISLTVKPSKEQRVLLERSVADFALEHADLLARTDRVQQALDATARLARKHPRDPDVLAALAMARARVRKLEAAREALHTGLAIAPAHTGLFAAGRAIEAVSTVAAATPPEPLAQALFDAQIDVLLGLRETARRKLEQLLTEHPDALGAVALRIRLDALDRRPDRARAKLATAKQAMPEAAALWQSLERELDQIGGNGAAPR
jgi:tetratricopeptide (TPR) repeat protein